MIGRNCRANEREPRKFGDLVEKYEESVETPTEGYMRLGIRSHAKGTFHIIQEFENKDVDLVMRTLSGL